MNAIVLAAGLGNRLGSFTESRPKALVPVAGRELILRVLDLLTSPDIRERIVVTGFSADALTAFLRQHDPAVQCIHNPHFRDGSIRSVEAALPFMDDEFLLMNVDHIYPRSLFNLVLQQRRGITAVCDFDRPLVADDMKIALALDRTITAIGKELSDCDGGYIGMTYVARDKLDAYRKGLAHARADYGDRAPAEWILRWLMAAGERIEVCDTSGHSWLEVDTPEDLARAEAMLLEQKDFLS